MGFKKEEVKGIATELFVIISYIALMSVLTFIILR